MSIPSSNTPGPVSFKGAKGALYIRVSKHEQLLGYSPETQEEDLRNEANRLGIIISRIFRDNGVSGTGLKKRKGLQNLLNQVEDGQIDVILIWDLTRLSRNLMLQLEMVQSFISNGVSIVTRSGPFEFLTPEGKLTLQLLGAVAEFESRKIGERAKRGLARRWEEHKWTGGVIPYGYEFNKKTERLNIKEVEAKVIRELFQRYLEEETTLYNLTNWINTTELKPRRAMKFKYVKIIRQILSNRRYIGEQRNRKGDVHVEVNMKLIDEEIFLKVQSKLKQNMIFSPNYRGKYANIDGFIKQQICSNCGKKVLDQSNYCSTCGHQLI